MKTTNAKTLLLAATGLLLMVISVRSSAHASQISDGLAHSSATYYLAVLALTPILMLFAARTKAAQNT